MKYNRLKKSISVFLILIMLVGVIINIFLSKEVKAVTQSTKDYKKGSNILDNYSGYSDLIDDLLEKHSNWTFTILFTGLDWNEVIRNETTASHGRSLVQKTSGEWVCPVCGDKKYDNGSWRCASAAAVSYYMDPRNSLNEDYIFQFENLKWADGKYTVEGVKKIISDCNYLQGNTIKYTKTDGTTGTINKSYAQAIMDAAKSAGISPYHLASRIRQEQGPGNETSLISGTYPNYKGYYNYLNIGAYGSGDTAIITNGLKYAKSQGWTDPEKAMKGGAEFLAEGYISQGQNTLYLQKYDVDNSKNGLYWHQYQQNIAAAKTEGQSIMQTYEEIDSNLNMSFNFVIPVYENMPSTRCPIPGTQSIVTQNIEITDSSVVVYKSKDKNSSKLATLKKGSKILRIEAGSTKENGYIWDKVVLDNGTKGYIVSSGFKIIDDITNCEITAISTKDGNVRNGPGTLNTTVLLTLAVGQRVTIIEKGKYKNIDGYDWSRIKLADGTQGYIVASYLEEVKDGSTSSGKDIVKVVCSSLSVREKPGTSSTRLYYADNGEILTRLEKDVSRANGYIWDKIVTSGGITGYVARGDDKENYIEPVSGDISSSISGDGFKTSNGNLICEPNVTVANIKAKVSSAKVKNASGKEVTSGNVGTGYTVSYNGTTYTVVKLGDVTGNGIVDSADLLAVQKHLLEKQIITGNSKLKAADATRNGKIDSADLLLIQKDLLGKQKISL